MNLWRRRFRKNNREHDLDIELRSHVDQQVQDYRKAGLSEPEARRRARLDFGALDEIKEECRDARPTHWIETVWKDALYGIRVLKASPAFTITAVLSLALGIGVNTAVFTLLHVALWKALPVRHPGEIVELVRTARTQGFSYYLFQKLTAEAPPFGDVAAKTESFTKRFGTVSDGSERVIGEAVSANFFSALEVPPAFGRMLQSDDDNPGGAGNPVAVLSYAFWQLRFQADPTVIGKKVFLNEAPYTVVGIAPSGFTGLQPGIAIDIWVPLTAYFSRAQLQLRNNSVLSVFARLRPDADQAAAVSLWSARLHEFVLEVVEPRLLPKDRPLVDSDRISLRPAISGLAGIGQQYRQPLFLLMSVVVLVLLISCANVANLVMARNSSRQDEIAMRIALGAGRGRVALQLLTESLLIAAAGGVVGIIFAIWATRALISMFPRTRPAIFLDTSPDMTVLAFTAAVACATAVIFGLLPALVASRKIGVGVGSTGRTTRNSRAGRLLVAVQLALAFPLLIGAGLFLGTIRNLKAADLGFRVDGVLGFDVSVWNGTPKDRIQQSYAQIRDNIRRSPGVSAASYVWPSVYDHGYWSTGVAVEGRPGGPGNWIDSACAISVGPEFFETLEIGLVAGRYLDERDQDGVASVAVINESFAKAYFDGSSPIGRHVTQDGPSRVTREIVGVVRDAKHRGVREPVCRMEYLPAAHADNAYGDQGHGSFIVRTAGPSPAIEPFIRTAVSAVGGGAQIEQLQPFENIVDAMISQERMIATLSSVFGLVALALAAIGLYGVMTYAVAKRTREFGVRMALGARPYDVQGLVLKETAQCVLIGLVTGVPAALTLTRLISTMLYGVGATDLAIFSFAAAVLAAVAVLAGCLPAWAASRIDPVIALRQE
jgi:predicted permease